MVTSAMPGLPTITVAAGALMRNTRAMLTLTLIGAPSWACAGMGPARVAASNRAVAARRDMAEIRVLVLCPYDPPEW
ncbi:hypothetical protein D3C87_1875730 [compost metagenome]